MSGSALGWVWGLAVKPTQKLVMAAMADRADDEGYLYYSVATIARKTGLSRRAVQKCLSELRDLGLVRVEQQHDLATGRQTSNGYWLMMPIAEYADRERRFDAIGGEGARHAPSPLGAPIGRVHEVHPPPVEAVPDPGEGAPGAQGRVHEVHGEGAPDAPPGVHLVRGGVHEVHGGGCTTCAGGVHHVHGGGAPGAPNSTNLFNSGFFKRIAQTHADEETREDPQTSPRSYIAASGRRLEGEDLERFEAFMDAFAYKRGKSNAADAWLDAGIDADLMPLVLLGAKQEAKGREDLRARGGTPMYPARFIAHRRWEDCEDLVQGRGAPKRSPDDWIDAGKAVGVIWEAGEPLASFVARVKAGEDEARQGAEPAPRALAGSA